LSLDFGRDAGGVLPILGLEDGILVQGLLSEVTFLFNELKQLLLVHGSEGLLYF